MYRIIALIAVLLSTSVAAQQAQRYKDWGVECESNSRCIAGTQGDGVVVVVGRNSNTDALQLVFRVDPRAQPDTPASVRLDSGWHAPLNITACNEEYCQVVVRPDAVQTVFDQMRPDRGGVIAYMINGQQNIAVARFSLMGMSKAMSHF